MAAEMKPTTISNVFLKAVEERSSATALNVMRNGKHLKWTWNQFGAEAKKFAKSLDQLGVDERSCVNIMGFNSPEWAIAYFGGILHNNILSGVYTTNGAEACKYQASHSRAQVIVVDTIAQL